MKPVFPLRRLFRWLNLPSALLVAFLQRTPLLRVAAGVDELAIVSSTGAVLRSALGAVASLGAMHSLAGATSAGGPVVTQLVSNSSQPAHATVGVPFSEQVFFYSPSVTILAQSWSVGNTLPPGIVVPDGAVQGGKITVNTATGILTLSGTPTVAGTYTLTIAGYQYANLTPPSTSAVATIIVAPAVNAAPAITQQPSDVTALVGAGATFSVLYTGTPAPSFQWAKDGAPISGATSSTLTLANLTATDAGVYTVALTNSLGTVTSNGATLTVNLLPAAPAFTASPVSQSVTAGTNVVLSVVVTGQPAPTLQWLKDGLGLDGANGPTLTLTNVQPADAGHYSVTASNSSGTITSDTATLTVNAAGPVVSQAVSAGASVTLAESPPAGGAAATYQWQLDGNSLAGATSSTLALTNMQPVNTGLYTVVVASGGTATSDTAIIGLATASKVVGDGSVIGENIVHPNHNIFDQVLLTGTAESITADPGKVTRTSFIDMTNDIVQVEFSGAGTLSVVLDTPSGPAAPVNYNQPTVAYMKGHAGIVITGADETTNVSVFTVGRATAFDPTGGYNILLAASATNVPTNNGSSLFQGHAGTTYDGVADISFIAISSTDGKFGGVRTSNATYFATQGMTGVYAPGVQFQGPVFIGNISAFNAATPVILLGSAGDVRITGGDLLQNNAQAVQVSGITQLKFTAGGDSNGNTVTAKADRAILRQNGADVTTQLVVNPSP